MDQMNRAAEGSWRQYIDEKFGDPEVFQIRERSVADGGLILVDVLASNGTSMTFFLAKGGDRLGDIQFSNKASVAFTGENDVFVDDGIFNPANVKYADDILAIPLKQGWRSEDYFLRGRHFKSKVFLTQDKPKAFHFVPSPFGCIASVFLLPLTPLLTFMIDKSFIGEKKTVSIGPVRPARTPSLPRG